MSALKALISAFACIFLMLISVQATELEDYTGQWEGAGEGRVEASIRRGTRDPSFIVAKISTSVQNQCFGEVEVFGRIDNDFVIRATTFERDEFNNEFCEIDLELVGRQALRITERSGCGSYHGTSCAFSGNLSRAGR